MTDRNASSWRRSAKQRFPMAHRGYLTLLQFKRDIVVHLKVVRVNGALWPRFFRLFPSGKTLVVNSRDRRVRSLLTLGPRYYQRNQFFCYLVTREFPVDLFVDVGANYGECTFSTPDSYSGRIVAIEANAAVADYLSQTKGNEAAVNVEIRQSLISDKSSQPLDFYIDKRYSGTSSVVRPVYADTSRYEKVTRYTESLDQIFDSDRPDFILIKIDVEGHEPSVLKGSYDLIERSQNVICFVEFDSEYLSRSGMDPQTVLLEWSERFDLWEIDRKERIIPLNRSFMHGSGLEGIHTDVVLTKFCSKTFEHRWEDIRSKSLIEHQRTIPS